VLAGKYVVERLLGLGGMGAVLAARHLELDERVAIKMLLPGVTPQGEPVARFIREARAAIKIRSDHVVRILDVARLDDGSPYIVMEYLDGSDLSRLVEERGPLPVDDAIEYVVQACEAIASAHAMGIVHRDLKPANLFLVRTNDGRPCVKVLDFGISKISGGGGATGLTSTTTIMGTPCFMSPEQLRSTRDVDARADIWSIGAILHALLSGAPPYDGESNADVSAKIIRDAPTPIRELRSEAPQAVEAIILRCLEKEPTARYADVAELARALAGVTSRDSVKTSAARVARGAIASAPTPESSAPRPAMTTGDGPTRTASAWGETGREDKSGVRGRSNRRVAGLVAGAVALGVIGTLGVVRWQQRPPPAAAISSPPPPVAVVTTTTSEPSAAPAGAPPAASSVAPPSAPVASAPAKTPTAAGTPTSKRPPAATTTPPAPTRPAGGLFDGRE
jgi:serine/threonine-protein kinase